MILLNVQCEMLGIIFLIFSIVFIPSNHEAMKSLLILTGLIFSGLTGLGQSSSIDLTFTAVNTTTHIQMDSVKVMDRTQGGDTVLYWPDTVLSIYYFGMHEHPMEENAFQVFQNYHM